MQSKWISWVGTAAVAACCAVGGAAGVLAAADEAAAVPPPADPSQAGLVRVTWLGKSADWADAANWSGGRVPGPDEVACFLAAPDGKASAQPALNGPAVVGGLYFDNGRLKPSGAMPDVPGAKPLRMNAPVTWRIEGAGRLSLGKGGVAFSENQGAAVIYPDVELRESQIWSLGRIVAPGIDYDDGLSLRINDCYGASAILSLMGKLSGPGDLCKIGMGRVYYANAQSPAITGEVRIENGFIEWRLPTLSASADYRFGERPIVLDGGVFAFGAAECEDQAKQIPTLTTPVVVRRRNGVLEYSQEVHAERPGKAEGEKAARRTPHSRFTGAIALGGTLKFEHNTLGGASSRMLVDGPITLDQQAPATLALALGDFNTDRWNDLARLTGKISDGPGAAGNPLILRSYTGNDTFKNAANDYAGPTIVAMCGFGADSPDWWQPMVWVEPQARLGKGDLIVEPGGAVALTAPATNLARGATVRMRTHPLTLSTLFLTGNALPNLSKDSSGAVCFSCDAFDCLTDLSALGDGHMFIGAGFDITGKVNWPKFTGDRLAPGAGDVYRLGAGLAPCEGGNGSAWQALQIMKGVLTGDAALQVGAPVCRGLGSVRLNGPNTFTGPITVWGRGTHLMGVDNTMLDGLVQATKGDSPFGFAGGPVSLYSATLSLTGAEGAAEPVHKGVLIFSGPCVLNLSAGKGPRADLALADVRRDATCGGILHVRFTGEAAGDRERLRVDAWKEDTALLPPYLLCALPKQPVQFASYDAKGGRGVGAFAGYKTDLTSAGADDVVKTAALNLQGVRLTVRALQTTGDITGTGRIAIASGGLIAGGRIEPDIDFGAVEGIIQGAAASRYAPIAGRVSGSDGLTLSTVDLANPANDFRGATKINGSVQAIWDSRNPDGSFTHGSLGDAGNTVIVNGGGLTAAANAKVRGNCLAPTRTLHLGPNGASLCSSGTATIYARISGPGMLTTPGWMAGRLVIDNPANDYTGGTYVDGMAGIVATARARLGTGPVFVRADDAMLVCEGDFNIHPKARLTVSHEAIAAFKSPWPAIGSLEGSGFVCLGGETNDTCLTVGGDNTDTTFYGMIRDTNPRVRGRLRKIGKGTFTLYGGQAYRGATLVESGTLVLRGSLAGDAVVKRGAVLVLKGTVHGKVTTEDGGTVNREGTGEAGRP